MKNPKKYDAKLTTSTLTGIDCMITAACNAEKIYKEKSTVNEKMSINHDKVPGALERQTLNVLMIGNGGHRNVAMDGIDIPRPIRHQPTDVSLYGAVPLAARPYSNDFNPVERLRYCLRKLEEHKGQRYWMYYGMPVNVRGKSTGYYQVTQVNGNKTVTEFEYTDLNVRPPRPEIPNFDNYDSKDEIVVPANGTYVTGNIVYDIPFDENAVQEYMNVCKVLYGDPGAAIISEFSLCYSVLKEISVDTASSLDTMMTESLGVQTGIFVSTFNNVAMDNGGLIWAVQVGQSTPLATASKDVSVNRQSGF